MSATVSRRFALEDAESPSIAGEFKQWSSDSRTGTGHFMPTGGLSMQEVEGIRLWAVPRSESPRLPSANPRGVWKALPSLSSRFNSGGGHAHACRMDIEDTALTRKFRHLGLP
jgi:hypothetical protein